MTHTIPEEFMPKHPIRYPSDNVEDFERWLHNNFRPTKNLGRTYLPIQWTAYYCKNGYGQTHAPIQRLQEFLNGLPPGKHFTVVQYDDGILNDVSHLDLRVYSMSGKPMNYPLPLICQPHSEQKHPKRLLCNFIGSNTHPLRSEVLRLRGKSWYMSTLPHKMPAYCKILAESTYTLCPRGYGPSSFRIMEALQQGSIPVYISDSFVIPHAVPFGEYGILIRPDQIQDIPRMLEGLPTPPVPPREAYEKWFTYEAVQKLIFDDLLKCKE